MATMTRRSVFAPKEPKRRYQGITTEAGGKLIEAARLKLAKRIGVEADRISDGDVFEYLARGEVATDAYLAKHAV